MLRNEKPQCVTELYALVNIIRTKQGHHTLKCHTCSHMQAPQTLFPHFFIFIPRYSISYSPHINL